MKTANTILLALLPADTSTSTDILAEKLRQSPKVLKAYLEDLEIDGLVTRNTIAAGTITVWRLTSDGLTVTNSLHQPA
jgi:DNA-binding HxlR family transcriptional regulator